MSPTTLVRRTESSDYTTNPSTKVALAHRSASLLLKRPWKAVKSTYQHRSCRYATLRGARVLRSTLLGLSFLSAASCVTVDHNKAAAIGTAGMLATESLTEQTSGAIQTLSELNKWWAVDDRLVCISTGRAMETECVKKAEEQRKNPKVACEAVMGRVETLRKVCVDTNEKEDRPDPKVEALIGVLGKQKQAVHTLNQAYAAFVDLAHYNAGKEATAALKTSFASIDSFLRAVSVIAGGIALPVFSSTVEKVSGGILGFIADNRQNAEILAKNTDLVNANKAFSDGVCAERQVMVNILSNLEQERETLYRRGFDAGLIDPTDALTPVFSEAYPGIRLRPPAPQNRDVVMAAANAVVKIENRQVTAAVASSYNAALSTLNALRTQQKNLEKHRTIDLGAIRTEINNLKVDVSQMTTSSSSSASK